MKWSVLILFIITTFYNIKSVNGDRILFLLPLATRSETHLFVPLAKELALKGHAITFVSPVPSNVKLSNFKEINPMRPFDMNDFDKEKNPIQARKNAQNKLAWLSSGDWSFVSDGCHTVFKNAEFQKLFREHFDLLIISANFNNCFDGLVYKFQAPFIFLSSMPLSSQLAENLGLRLPPSFVPNPFLEYTDSMIFGERVINTLMSWIFSFLIQFVMAPENDKIFRQYLGQDYPSSLDIERNVSLLLSNSHFSLTTPRPVLPDIVEIGGIHCREPNPLPKDLDDFLSGKDGFIYFSLGSVVKGVFLPEETRKMFLNVFSRLKQKVLWKYETEEMPDLPPNVKLSKWLPQQDILGHKNIRLFISHGGLLSTQESAYHGVSVIGIPFFVDQDVNMKQAEKQGFAISLEILDLTEEILENSIREILDNPKYSKKAKEVSKIFKDRPNSPLETAVYWTDYVLKHKGAHHLRSGARDLYSFQYHSYDVIALIVSVLLIAICITRKLFKLCRCRKTQQYTNTSLSSKKRK